MNWTTLGKSRVRESRTLGSVGAKPNGLATRPSPLSKRVRLVRVAVALQPEAYEAYGLPSCAPTGCA